MAVPISKTNARFLVIVLSFGLTLTAGCTSQQGQVRENVSVRQAAASSESPGILEATRFRGSLIGMQYEPWFTPQNVTWNTAEAVPILGKYSSYNVSILKKHAEWFEDLGVNWVLIDWSNMLWMTPKWEEQKGATRQLEETTELLFKTYSQLQQEGQNPPRIVFLLGLQNGPPVKNGVARLEKIFDWVNAHLLSNPRYKDLWLYYNGKPLVTILYNPQNPCRDLEGVLKAHPLNERKWTIRWMASQLQDNHAEKCGFWSWMDGTIRQVVIYHAHKPEEVVVTPSCFAGGGWLAPTAVGRDHGAPYLESWKVAFQTHPKFIQIHQWNEFAGQPKGRGYGPKHHVYVDEYSPEFSDDIEPTHLNKCAYRGCGGWGYYYFNLTKALISLYRKETPDITVMALSAPFNTQRIESSKLPLKWVTVGTVPTGYSLELDGKTVVNKIQGETYTLNLSHISSGKHHVTLIAHGVHTYFNLNPKAQTHKSVKPVPVTSTVEFQYAPR